MNSRGRAALREAHGKIRRRIDPVRVKLVSLFDPFRVGSPLPLQPWASRKAARPRLLNLVLSGPEFLLKKQEVNRLFHRGNSDTFDSINKLRPRSEIEHETLPPM